MKRVNLRLDVTEGERDLIRRAAALAGHRSMAEFCRTVILREAKHIDSHIESGGTQKPQPRDRD